jgi:RNA polymerase-binding transcription factor DksA
MPTTDTANDHAGNHGADAARLEAEATRAKARLAQLEAEYEVLLADPGTLQEDRDTTRQLVEEARHTARAADAAVARVSAGTYGRCEHCGGEIGEERLAALPDATTCIACQSR